MLQMHRKDAFITMKTNRRKDGNTGKSAKDVETIKFKKDGCTLVIKKHASSCAKEKFTHQVVASMMKILKNVWFLNITKSKTFMKIGLLMKIGRRLVRRMAQINGRAFTLTSRI
jgi:hypothetical protein